MADHRVHLKQDITKQTSTNPREESWGWFCMATGCSAGSGKRYATSEAAATDGAQHLDTVQGAQA